MLYIVIGECWFCWKSLNPFPGPINPDSHPSHFCFFLVCWEWAFSPSHTFNYTFIFSTQYSWVSTIWQEWRVVIWFLTLLERRITLSSLLRNDISPRDSDSLVRSPRRCIFKLVCQVILIQVISWLRLWEMLAWLFQGVRGSHHLCPLCLPKSSGFLLKDCRAEREGVGLCLVASSSGMRVSLPSHLPPWRK